MNAMYQIKVLKDVKVVTSSAALTVSADTGNYVYTATGATTFSLPLNPPKDAAKSISISVAPISYADAACTAILTVSYNSTALATVTSSCTAHFSYFSPGPGLAAKWYYLGKSS